MLTAVLAFHLFDTQLESGVKTEEQHRCAQFYLLCEHKKQHPDCSAHDHTHTHHCSGPFIFCVVISTCVGAKYSHEAIHSSMCGAEVTCVVSAEVYLSPAACPLSGSLCAALRCRKEENKNAHSTSCSPPRTHHDTNYPQLCLPATHKQEDKTHDRKKQNINGQKTDYFWLYSMLSNKTMTTVHYTQNFYNAKLPLRQHHADFT